MMNDIHQWRIQTKKCTDNHSWDDLYLDSQWSRRTPLVNNTSFTGDDKTGSMNSLKVFRFSNLAPKESSDMVHPCSLSTRGGQEPSLQPFYPREFSRSDRSMKENLPENTFGRVNFRIYKIAMEFLNSTKGNISISATSGLMYPTIARRSSSP